MKKLTVLIPACLVAMYFSSEIAYIHYKIPALNPMWLLPVGIATGLLVYLVWKGPPPTVAPPAGASAGMSPAAPPPNVGPAPGQGVIRITSYDASGELHIMEVVTIHGTIRVGQDYFESKSIAQGVEYHMVFYRRGCCVLSVPASHIIRLSSVQHTTVLIPEISDNPTAQVSDLTLPARRIRPSPESNMANRAVGISAGLARSWDGQVDRGE